jgi:hypothetical protein
MTSTTITGNVFQTTLAAFGGGVYLNGGSSILLQDDSEVSYHDVSGDPVGYGAGIFATEASTVTLDSSQVTHNTADYDGGGVDLNANSLLNLQNGSSIDYNMAIIGDGGGVNAFNSEVTILDSIIEHNRAGDDGGGVYLGGSSSLDAINSTFHYNRSVGDGGGIASESTGGVDIDADFDTCDPASGPCSLFSSNEADMGGTAGGNGGAVYLLSGDVDMDHTVLKDNTAKLGGAFYQTGDSSYSQLENSLFYGNSIDSSYGAAVRVFDGSMIAHHLTLSDNSVAPAFSAAPSSSVELYNSIAWGNPSGGFNGSGITTYACNIDQSGVAGVVSDPLFVDPSSDDYHLRLGSPAIDACTTGLPLDLDGFTRPVGAQYDMGVFEFLIKLFLPLVLK